VHRWSNKKRSKTVLRKNVFPATIREVQVQVEAANPEPSVTSSAMNVHMLRQLSEAQGASSAAVPLPTDGRGSLTTPVPGGYWSQEAQNLNSPGKMTDSPVLRHISN